MKRLPAYLMLHIFCTFCVLILQMPGVISTAGDLNRCLDGKHHKEVPGPEGDEFKKYHCSPWAERSCCTSKTAQSIQRDGVLTLYNMKWNHCGRNLSRTCRDWFMKDTCFYECSPNLGPFLVVDKRSKITRKERVLNVPLCASDCDAWFEACKDDLTCSDNWGKNWKWTKQGNQCIKECKTFKEYFHDSQNFCNEIFDATFEYTHGKVGKDCFTLWPNVTNSGSNPNTNVATIAQKSEKNAAAVSEKVFNFLDKCIATNYHKSKPGQELGITECVPWRPHACCSKNTTDAIKKDGGLTLYNMRWDHCGNLSEKCRDYFIKDTCFYSCSPNLAPWIVSDNIPKKARTERVLNIPLCSQDCDGWFEACKDDYTCSDNWGETWKWSKNGNKCKLKCKRFKDYFQNSVTFCNKIFNHSFAYTEGKHGEDCMSLWPDGYVRDLNREFAAKAAHQLVGAGVSLNAPMLVVICFIVSAVVLLQNL